MKAHTLTLYDEQGNPIPIPAIRGVGIKEIRLKEAGETADTYEIVLDNNRVFSFQTKHGKDYTLTEVDKSEIAGLIDIPDEGDFELIKEITIGEDGVAQVDSEGLSLSKVLVKVSIPAPTPAITIKVLLNDIHRQPSEGTICIDLALKQASDTYPVYCVAYAEARNGRMFGDSALSIAYETNNNNVQHFRSVSLIGFREMSEIKDIRLSPFNATFLIGTKITILGVRANA